MGDAPYPSGSARVGFSKFSRWLAKWENGAVARVAAGFFAALGMTQQKIASRSDAKNLTPNPFPRGKGNKILGEEAES